MKFGRYEILEELGRGGFGVVYRARDNILGRFIALKVLHGQLTIDPGFISRFKQEARLAAQLEHPNLVPVHDLGQQNGLYYISMGFMAGGSLKDRLKQGALPKESIDEIFPHILRGLKVIHENGIIHRDLKPANILFDQYGIARISDLGFAKALYAGSGVSLTMSGDMFGTPAYMAPEIWHGNQATERSDIYSLGCTLYEILTGEVLFKGTSPAVVLTKHLIDGPQYKKELAENWCELLNKCLAMDPKDRYQQVGSILEDYYTAVRDKSVQVSVPSPEELRNGQNQEQREGTLVSEVTEVTEAIKEDVSKIEQAKAVENIPPETGEKRTATVEQLSKNRSADAVGRTVNWLAAILIAIAVVVLAVLAPIYYRQSPVAVPIRTTIRVKDGMEMVYIPAGEFTMGSEDGANDERPVRKVYLDAYWIDKYEVSNAQYALCVEAGACSNPKWNSSFSHSNYYGNPDYDNYPVVYVNWYQAETYCEWTGGSLPTEAQWEKAAGGTGGQSYPWGDERPTCNLVNKSGCTYGISSVTDYQAGASPYGALNMAGNVWEWVYDWYGPYKIGETNNPDGPSSGSRRVFRGGSCVSSDSYVRTADRGFDDPTYTNNIVGFRCIFLQP